jgi:hypothetical protein
MVQLKQQVVRNEKIRCEIIMSESKSFKKIMFMQ